MKKIHAYTLAGAAEATGLSPDFLRRAIRSTDPGMHLPARMAGNRYLILADDLSEWLRNLPEA